MKKLGHIDENGKIRMIDNTDKPVRIHEAEATGFIQLKPETVRLIKENEMEKGEVISIAEISGIQAAKKASDLIPLINPVDLTGIDVKAYVYQNGIEVKSHVRSECRSSLEIEALSAVSVALLTLYEMCKSVDHTMTISDIKISKKIQE